MNASISIIRGTNNKPVSSRELAKFFSEPIECQGYLFIGYPIINTAEGRHPIDALLVSPEKGIVVFDLVDGDGIKLGDFGSRQDDSANKLEARLKTHRELMSRRDLLIPIHTITFAPAIKDISRHNQQDYLLANLNTLADTLASIEKWQDKKDNVYETALSAIQNISTIRKSRAKRTITNENSLGAKLKNLEDSIATLDNLQNEAVIETVDGVQRIRGLAGSGKTIVLALKAAYLHTQHPDWRIAVTFNTRSLKGQFRRLINNFSLEQTGEEPNWDNLRVLNAWGAPNNKRSNNAYDERDGIYYEFCRAHDMPYLDFYSAKNQFGSDNAFSGACERAINQIRESKPLYDAILVDETQDFPPSFLRLCYALLNDHKRLVYAYDELQNLSGASLPPPEEIFGKKADGSPVVNLEAVLGEPRRDVILEKCYRNSRPVLVTAHALGFGIYRKPSKNDNLGLVQMFEHSQLWNEIGYQRKSGELRGGSPVVLYRTNESSPKFLEEHSPINELVQFIPFKNEEEQTNWLVNAINHNVKHDELRHDDIFVINPDPLTTRQCVGAIRQRLLEHGINSHLAGVDTEPDVFFQPDSASITFTGIYRAKGNEAGMVYIINAQDCHSATWNLATIRNRLFTAITRSKAWVRVLGFGEGMSQLIEEFNSLKSNDFELHFTYPTDEQLKTLKIIHRDMTDEDRKRLDSNKTSVLNRVKDLKDPEKLAKIDAILKEG